MTNNKQLEKTITQLCNEHYIIPIYQRNYAWEDDEINQLIDDISDAFCSNSDKHYYIGSLVVYAQNDFFEVIDGQQRLTTLKLILLALKNQGYQKGDIHLSFKHRSESNKSFKKLARLEKGDKFSNAQNTIEYGYLIALAKLNEIKIKFDKDKNPEGYKEFICFLLEKVLILRTEVPKDTDLNHYFEIMNNRGEQLEKHEVLKASLMAKLNNENERVTFAKIWEICSDMNKYAVMSLPTNIRKKYYNSLPLEFGSLSSDIQQDKGLNKLSIEYILSSYKQSKKNEEHQKSNGLDYEKYISIIDFPNFLLHVLRLFCESKDVILNDKELLKEFERKERYFGRVESIKKFIMLLLRVRLLFDWYIIKSDKEDNWVLFRLNKIKNKSNDQYYFSNSFNNEIEQQKLKHLLSMFHCSFRQRIYKEWLFDVLSYLNEEHSDSDSYRIKSKSYISWLEHRAELYYKIRAFVDEKVSILDKGTNVPHYIFNYLDYLIWKNQDIEVNEKTLKRDDFYFSQAKNSVEHCFPQNNASELKSDDVDVDNFGNLCLISNYQNSTLSDHSFESKKSRYENGELKCNSLIQAAIFKYETWDAESIKEHRKKMIALLEKR